MVLVASGVRIVSAANGELEPATAGSASVEGKARRDVPVFSLRVLFGTGSAKKPVRVLSGYLVRLVLGIAIETWW
jgi:hypothetical protein